MIKNHIFDNVDVNSSEYKNADPFPSIVLDDFLERDTLHNVQKEAYTICSKPSESWRFGGRPNSKDEHEFQMKKRGVAEIDKMPFHLKNLVSYLNSDKFVSYISDLTGKPDLVADPLIIGGGLHETKKGGLLGIHHDFNEYPNLMDDGETYYRQVNLLLYINAHWESEWGGELELWNKDMSSVNKIIDIVPNRCVIFNIDGAPHGHPNPLNTPSDISRRSIAMYYYSKEVPKFSKIRKAHWAPELKNMI